MTKGKKILAHAVLILASFLSVFPLYYMLCGATNTSIDVVRGKLIPGTYLVENFNLSHWLPTRIWGWQWQTPSATPS
mgnify:CR=1 FL=1